uniref:Tex_N domain-containing protein n=2 Tax=Caenorhabditis japonica TaxID=281687 RepID=A0A8R1E3E8_CAEJA
MLIEQSNANQTLIGSYLGRINMRRQAIIGKEWILQKPIETFIAEEIPLKPTQATRLCQLFKEGCESAYIARYRGDVHGGLPPEDIRKAMEAYLDAVELNKKVSNALTTVTAKVEGAGEKKMVAERLKACEDVQEVTEISKEFSTGGRKTKASVARELGLEPAAKSILDGEFVDLKAFISKEMKNLKDVEENLKICLADMINRNDEVKKVALKVVP